MTPPTSTVGNAALAATLLAGGTVLGAGVGYAASPLPASNKFVGAVEGGTIGALLTALGGLLTPYYAPRWTRVGQTAGIVGVGALAAMAVVGAARAAHATPKTPALPAAVTTTTFDPGGTYEIGSQVPSGTQDAGTLLSQLQAAGWSNVSVLFFGPTATSLSVPVEIAPLMQNMNGPTAYVAKGTWSGASQAVPTGVVALKVG